MTQKLTVQGLHFVASEIRQLAAAAACAQLDMAQMKREKGGKGSPLMDWPLERLDDLAERLAQPALTRLAHIERMLTTRGEQ